MMFSFWTELVTYLEHYSYVMYEKWRLTQMVTLCFHWQYFCVLMGTRVKLLECIFVISKSLVEFDLFGID